MRLTYPGITKLVVVKSVYNDTPAGRAAIDVVASYYSALATATADGTVEPAKRLVAPTCAQCLSDVDRIAGYVRLHERAAQPDGSPITWRSTSIFVESIGPGGIAYVDFDGQQPAARLVRSDGTLVGRTASSFISDRVTVQIRSGRAVIIDQQSRS